MKKLYWSTALMIGMLILMNELDRVVQTEQRKAPTKTSSVKTSAKLALAIPQARPLAGLTTEHKTVDPFSPMQIAEQYLQAHREDFNIQSYHELRPELRRTPLSTHVHFSVYQDNVWISGVGLTIEVDPSNGQITSVDNRYRPFAKIELHQNLLPPQEVIQEAALLLGHSPANLSVGSTIIFTANEPEPAYIVHSRQDSSQMVFSASSGQLLSRSVPRN
ncbi:MAG: hypothetical protein HY537_12140 [Deltaproteobacteria bacterium]|nr:hypothetical protein [Deltaproteobacteria bacterium]